MKRFFSKQTWIIWITTLAVVAGLGAAMRTYTGPDRTRTETGQACVYRLRYCMFRNDRWLWNAEDSWSCGNQSQPWLAYQPIAGRECTLEIHESGENAYGYQKETVVTEISVTYPPATISAQPLCSLAGQNGWCRAGAGLQLTGQEPVSGYSIFALGGTRNGVAFTLQGATETIPALEGQNNFEYWAYSTWGDTSLKGTSTLRFDSESPVLGNVEIIGTSGSNDWLKSAALHASASDPSPGSGMDGLAYTLDGGSNWASLVSPVSLPDGIHSLQVRASDLAGNMSLSDQTEAKVDSVAPTLAISESGTGGANGWYISQAQVSASAQDGGSGLAALEYSLNNGAWSAYSAPLILPDGSHSLNFWAEDFAGWVTQESRSIQVDTQAPNISGNISGTLGTNGWYVSTVTLTASASDPSPGSGIDAFTYLLNGGPATAYSAPINLTDGQHSLTLSARDKAGLESSQDMLVKVDSIPPGLQIQTTLPDWVQDTVTLHGAASDAGSGLQRVEISFDNGQTWQAASGATAWSLVWDTHSAASGARTLYVKSTDMAGLSTILPFAVQVDNQAPQIQLPGAWDIWDAVTFNAHDSDSGLASAELVISDPQNRWPKRVYSYAPGHLPLSFQWDRRFADGTLAPMGSYDVSATATDRMGNTRKVSASLRILIVLPPPPTSTPLGEPLATATPTATASALATLAATSTPTSGAGSIPFGATEEPPALGAAAPTPSLAPRATPTESPFTSWLGSLFTPASQPPAAEDDGPSPIDWGAGALAAAAGMSAYYLAKRREEEEAQRQAVREQVAAKNEALRAQEAQQREQAKIENYLQGKAMLEAQLAQSGLADSGKKVLASPAPDISMPQGVSAEAQQAFLYGGSAAQGWIDNNAAQLQAEQQAKLEKQQRDSQARDTAASYSSQAAAWLGIDKYIHKPKAPKETAAQEKPWWETAWNAVTTTAQNATTTVSGAVAGIFPQQTNETYKLASPTQHSTGETPGLWDYIKGDIFQGLSDIKQTISNTAAGIVQNINGVGNEVGDSVSGVWSGKLTMDQAWNNVVVAAQNAYSNSNSLIAQGKKEIVETYTQTTDVVLHKTADWLDSKRNPVYDLFAYGLEGISQKKLIDTRDVAFSSFLVDATKGWLGEPDFMELSASVAGGYIAGLVQGVDMVVLPSKGERPEYGQPDLNSFAFFHSPGVQLDLPGAGAVACSGYGYMNKDKYTIDDYLGSVANLGLGGFFPVIPVGGNIEAYHSLSPDVSQEMLSDIGKQISLNPGSELSWEIAEKLADARILPSHYGPLSSPDEAVLGYRVCLGAGTPGWDAHVSITDAEYINILGHEMKYDNVPTPIINAIIDFMEIKPKDWQW